MRRRYLGMASIDNGIPVKFAPYDPAEQARPVIGPDTPSGVSGANAAAPAADEIIGYKIGDHVYHPSDVEIIRRCKP